ncbi:unnamed protein product, partial [Discosporangium mesarthrocarpum]
GRELLGGDKEGIDISSIDTSGGGTAGGGFGGGEDQGGPYYRPSHPAPPPSPTGACVESSELLLREDPFAGTGLKHDGEGALWPPRSPEFPPGDSGAGGGATDLVDLV